MIQMRKRRLQIRFKHDSFKLQRGPSTCATARFQPNTENMFARRAFGGLSNYELFRPISAQGFLCHLLAC